LHFRLKHQNDKKGEWRKVKDTSEAMRTPPRRLCQTGTGSLGKDKKKGKKTVVGKAKKGKSVSRVEFVAVSIIGSQRWSRPEPGEKNQKKVRDAGRPVGN